MDTPYPIASTEQLLAKGEYNYQVAGRDSGLTESWSLHRRADGDLAHRATVHGLITGFELTQQTHLILKPDYRPHALEMRQNIEDKKAARLAQTSIRCLADKVVQTIKTDNLSEEQTIEAPAGYRLFFPPVSAQGFILTGYDLSLGGRQTVPLISIRIQPESGLPLSAELQAIEYEYLDAEQEIETPAGQFRCRHFIRYDQHMKQQLWLDENWITIQWSVPYSEIMQWEYLLTRYRRKS